MNLINQKKLLWIEKAEKLTLFFIKPVEMDFKHFNGFMLILRIIIALCITLTIARQEVGLGSFGVEISEEDRMTILNHLPMLSSEWFTILEHLEYVMLGGAIVLGFNLRLTIIGLWWIVFPLLFDSRSEADVTFRMSFFVLTAILLFFGSGRLSFDQRMTNKTIERLDKLLEESISQKSTSS